MRSWTVSLQTSPRFVADSRADQRRGAKQRRYGAVWRDNRDVPVCPRLVRAYPSSIDGSRRYRTIGATNPSVRSLRSDRGVVAPLRKGQCRVVGPRPKPGFAWYIVCDAGFAVGLDTPESARTIACVLAEAGYAVGALPEADDLMRRLTGGDLDVAVSLDAYRTWLAGLPEALRETLRTRWGAPEDDPVCTDGAFRFRSVLSCDDAGGSRAGALQIFLQPDRGRSTDRKAGYHDPDEPPTHGYLAFHLGLRTRFDALIHLGTHGTTEWLPGKAVALSPDCWPALAVLRYMRAWRSRSWRLASSRTASTNCCLPPKW